MTAIENHTCGLRKAPSSVRALLTASLRPVWAGTRAAMPTKASTPMTVIAQNVERQPAAWPSSVPSGTPSTFARVSPPNMKAIALALRSGATSWAATTAPMPKKAPWHRAATTRPAIITSYDGARAEIRLPATKSTISPSRAVLRGTRVRARVSPTAPTATLRA